MSRPLFRSQVNGSYWVYQYDALGQVTSGKKYWSDGSLVADNSSNTPSTNWLPKARHELSFPLGDVRLRSNAASSWIPEE